MQIVKDGFLEEVMIELCQKGRVEGKQVKMIILNCSLCKSCELR